jgi:hypothetical protein
VIDFCFGCSLPLSIDEPTLFALVSPYVIKSSRFFQTKLSHPPRIIDFVRCVLGVVPKISNVV